MKLLAAYFRVFILPAIKSAVVVALGLLAYNLILGAL